MHSAKCRLASLLACIFAIAAGPAGAETVLITGSNQGIGLEFARQYAARGWQVIATHRRENTPETLARLAREYPKVRVERMDVTDHGQIEALAAKLDGEPIDLLLHNAALIRFAPINDPEGNAGQMFGTLDYEHFDRFMRTNVAGPLKITEAFIEHGTALVPTLINIANFPGIADGAGKYPKYAAHMPGFSVLPIYGGSDFRGQLQGLRRGCHVVVGTPGRVMDHMRRGTLFTIALICEPGGSETNDGAPRSISQL